jgi:hypothetical protein
MSGEMFVVLELLGELRDLLVFGFVVFHEGV